MLVEHLRDLPNLIVFGPGALHFLTESSWRDAIAASGLRLTERFRVTPFVNVFMAGR